MSNSTAVVPFQFHSHEIRTLNIKDEPWFVAKDVIRILELSNISMAIQSLDDDERVKFFLTPTTKAWIINESGLYALILRSNKPNAKAFRKWVTSEVLPAIRRKGAYEAARTTKTEYVLPKNLEDFARMFEGKKFFVSFEDGKPRFETLEEDAVPFEASKLPRYIADPGWGPFITKEFLMEISMVAAHRAVHGAHKTWETFFSNEAEEEPEIPEYKPYVSLADMLAMEENEKKQARKK